MKKITEFEEELLTKVDSRPRKYSFFPEFQTELAGLQVGNGKLLVTKKEWFEKYAKKTLPHNIIKNRVNSSNNPLFQRRFFIRNYEEGWVISRIQ